MAREKDEIIKEVCAARKKIAAECDYDFKKLLARYERMQVKNPEGLVDEVSMSDSERPEA
jgi:hypothetical protein